MNNIATKRIYENPTDDDGYRILVDRVWPRGVSKEDAKLDDWRKEIAPTAELRKWFGHDPDKFVEFAKRYRLELEDKKSELQKIRDKTKEHRVTLLYAAKDTQNNHANVLRKVLT